jgi:hypothetical protein
VWHGRQAVNEPLALNEIRENLAEHAEKLPSKARAMYGWKSESMFRSPVAPRKSLRLEKLWESDVPTTWSLSSGVMRKIH